MTITNQSNYLILHVEDDRIYRKIVQRMVRDHDLPFDVQTAASLAEAVESLKQQTFDAILLDQQLPDGNGLELFAHVESIPVVLLTGTETAQNAVEAMKKGAQDYLVKSELTAGILQRGIANAIEKMAMAKKLKEATKNLAQKNERLTQLYSTAHQFVDNVSHEFRTPLTVIKEYASLLHDGVCGPVCKQQIEFLDVIANRVDDLVLMVNDMLDISRLGAGMLRVVRKQCSVSEIVKHIWPNLERRAEINHVTLECDVPEDLPAVYCDTDKMGRTIINLAVNGIKFAAGGEGLVRVMARRAESGNEVTISVSDNGPGISKGNRKLIFDRFQQVDGDLRQSTKGFGLGLNIAKELVHLNLGQIMFTTEPGHGSDFYFGVPVCDPAIVMEQYLKWLGHRPESPHVSLIGARTSGVIDLDVVHEVEEFLQHVVRPRDLVLPRSVDSWLILVQCSRNEVRKLLGRFGAALEELNRNRPTEEVPPIQYDLVGSWDVVADRHDFVEQFTTAIACDEVTID